MKLYTIGHSNHPLESFMRLLENNGIMTLVDVRTAPYSRYSPHFNKENLEQALRVRDIQYAHAGKYLGGRPADPGCYKSRQLPGEGGDYLHEVDYPEVMKREWFQKGIVRLLELADEQTTTVMCSEEDPAQCHRHHLIAKYLRANYPDVKIVHIRGDGRIYSADTLRVSVNVPNTNQPALL